MMCPVCQSDTSVKDSRLQANGTVKRRRVCESGHKFNTWEGTSDATRVIEARRRAKKAYRERNPDRDRLDRLRREARAEAKEAGVPVEIIFQRWGVA